MHTLTEKFETTCCFPRLLLNNASPNLLIAKADGGNNFTDFGIHEGTILIFDCKKSFEDGMPALFFNEKENVVSMLRHQKDGFKYKAKLIATLNNIGG